MRHRPLNTTRMHIDRTGSMVERFLDRCEISPRV